MRADACSYVCVRARRQVLVAYSGARDAERMFTPKRTYTRAEVRRHNRPDDCWIIYHDKVYDVTKYLPTHPGGARFITDHAGEDVTYEFNDKPHTTKAKKILQVFCIGRVEKRVRGDPATIAAAATAAGAGAAGVRQSPVLSGVSRAGAAAGASVPPVPLFGGAEKPAVRIDYSLVDNRDYAAGVPSAAASTAHDRPAAAAAAASASGSAGGVAPMSDDPFRADFPAAASSSSAAAASGSANGFAITLTAPGSSQPAAMPVVQTTRSAAAIRLPDAVLNIAPPAAVAARNDAIAAATAAAAASAAGAGAGASGGAGPSGSGSSSNGNGAAKASASSAAAAAAAAPVAPGSIDAKDLISSLRAAQTAAKGAAGSASLKPLVLVKGEITKRKKEPLEPGCSPLHWNELINRMPRRPIRKITRAELATHNTIGDAWMALRGKVYDITDYVRFHPGGKTELMRGAGIDGTALFDSTHHWINIDYLLDKCMIGVLLG